MKIPECFVTSTYVLKRVILTWHLSGIRCAVYPIYSSMWALFRGHSVEILYSTYENEIPVDPHRPVFKFSDLNKCCYAILAN